MAHVDRHAFEELCERLDKGEALTFEAIGDIFGKSLWIMLVYTLLDAQVAARAIQSAILRIQAQAVLEYEDAKHAAEEKPSVILAE